MLHHRLLGVTGSALLACVLAAGLAACGSSTTSTLSAYSLGSLPLKAGESALAQKLGGKLRGGTLTVYDHDDFDHFDPGQAYFVEDYPVVYATQRPLYSYKPGNDETPHPRSRGGPAEDHRRRQDADGRNQARRPLQPPDQPRSGRGGRQIRDRARGEPDRRQPLLPVLLRRYRRRRKGRRGADQGDPDAELPDDRLPPHQAHGGAALRGPQSAPVGAGARAKWPNRSTSTIPRRTAPNTSRRRAPTCSSPTARASSSGSATCRASRRRSCATRTGTRRPTTARPT